jgi:hypothetical protein
LACGMEAVGAVSGIKHPSFASSSSLPRGLLSCPGAGRLVRTQASRLGGGRAGLGGSGVLRRARIFAQGPQCGGLHGAPGGLLAGAQGHVLGRGRSPGTSACALFSMRSCGSNERSPRESLPGMHDRLVLVDETQSALKAFMLLMSNSSAEPYMACYR